MCGRCWTSPQGPPRGQEGGDCSSPGGDPEEKLRALGISGNPPRNPPTSASLLRPLPTQGPLQAPRSGSASDSGLEESQSVLVLCLVERSVLRPGASVGQFGTFSLPGGCSLGGKQACPALVSLSLPEPRPRRGRAGEAAGGSPGEGLRCQSRLEVPRHQAFVFRGLQKREGQGSPGGLAPWGGAGRFYTLGVRWVTPLAPGAPPGSVPDSQWTFHLGGLVTCPMGCSPYSAKTSRFLPSLHMGHLGGFHMLACVCAQWCCCAPRQLGPHLASIMPTLRPVKSLRWGGRPLACPEQPLQQSRSCGTTTVPPVVTSHMGALGPLSSTLSPWTGPHVQTGRD